MLTLWFGHFEVWELNEKIRFDKQNKLIYINPDVTEISVKRDIYSATKRWAAAHPDNTTVPFPMRVIGGDPLVGGLFAGDIYFMINGWRILIDHLVRIDGTLYSDDFSDPYIIEAGGVISTVSNLVQSTSTTGGGSATCNVDEIADEIENRLNPTLSNLDVPVSSRSSSTEVADRFNTIIDLINLLNSKLDLVDDQLATFSVDITHMMIILDVVRKFNFNRSKIDPVNKTLTIYDDDEVTPIVVFELLDTNQNPSTDEVAEKVPRQVITLLIQQALNELTFNQTEI
jgi:hypothetical protein